MVLQQSNTLTYMDILPVYDLVHQTFFFRNLYSLGIFETSTSSSPKLFSISSEALLWLFFFHPSLMTPFSDFFNTIFYAPIKLNH